ncbi:MAG: histidinol-phosphatase [Oscillospiraceae bacterium]|nr:histidinol-phosphatase [Oscillospiraceae bacterium]
MYYYETHLHTLPVSGCARWSATEAVAYFKNAGYAGIFITNHFLDDDIPEIRALPYEQQIEQYFADYEEGLQAGREMGLAVFSGIEVSYKKTDFLIYGLDKSWYLAHPEIDGMPIKDFLALAKDEGALVIHAHPFREARSIDHIRLYPRSVHGVEIFNGNRSAFENEMALWYAGNYGLLHFAGSDIHGKEQHGERYGMYSETPVIDEQDFVRKVLAGEMKTFHKWLEPFIRR